MKKGVNNFLPSSLSHSLSSLPAPHNRINVSRVSVVSSSTSSPAPPPTAPASLLPASSSSSSSPVIIHNDDHHSNLDASSSPSRVSPVSLFSAGNFSCPC